MLAGAPELMRNSLILIGLALRTFSAAVSDCVCAVGRVCPGGVADQVAVEGRRSRGDLEGRAHACARRNRLGEGLRVSLAPATTDGPLLAGHGEAQLDARRGRTRGIGERHRGLLRGARRESLQSRRSGSCRSRRHAEPRHVVPGSDHVGLHQLIGGVGREGARGGHRAFIEGALRAVAVVAAVAQQDGSLLAHRIVGRVDARVRRT